MTSPFQPSHGGPCIEPQAWYVVCIEYPHPSTLEVRLVGDKRLLRESSCNGSFDAEIARFVSSGGGGNQ